MTPLETEILGGGGVSGVRYVDKTGWGGGGLTQMVQMVIK